MPASGDCCYRRNATLRNRMCMHLPAATGPWCGNAFESFWNLPGLRPDDRSSVSGAGALPGLLFEGCCEAVRRSLRSGVPKLDEGEPAETVRGRGARRRHVRYHLTARQTRSAPNLRATLATAAAPFPSWSACKMEGRNWFMVRATSAVA